MLNGRKILGLEQIKKRARNVSGELWRLIGGSGTLGLDFSFGAGPNATGWRRGMDMPPLSKGVCQLIIGHNKVKRTLSTATR